MSGEKNFAAATMTHEAAAFLLMQEKGDHV